MAKARRALSLQRAVGRIARPSGQALENRPLTQAALPVIPPNDCAQRPGVQRAAGSITLIDRGNFSTASGCQKRPDPAAPLERRVGPHGVYRPGRWVTDQIGHMGDTCVNGFSEHLDRVYTRAHLIVPGAHRRTKLTRSHAHFLPMRYVP